MIATLKYMHSISKPMLLWEYYYGFADGSKMKCDIGINIQTSIIIYRWNDRFCYKMVHVDF